MNDFKIDWNFKVSNNLMNEARALRAQVDKARRESYMNRLKLIQRLIVVNNSTSRNDISQQPESLDKSAIATNVHRRDESTAFAYHRISPQQQSPKLKDQDQPAYDNSSDSDSTSVNSSKKRKTHSTNDQNA